MLAESGFLLDADGKQVVLGHPGPRAFERFAQAYPVVPRTREQESNAESRRLPRKLTDNNYKQASLEDYGEEIRRVWGHYLGERPCLYTWLHAVEHATQASEGVRRRDWNIVLTEIARTITWWLAFILQLNDLQGSDKEELIFALPLTPSQIIWSKYPAVCPVDFGLAVRKVKKGEKVRWGDLASIPCQCMSRKRDVEGRSEKEKKYAKRELWKFSRYNRSKRPKYVSEMEEMFQRIFEPQASALSTEEVAFHFLEEVGEVSRALAELAKSRRISPSQTQHELLVSERVDRLKGLTEELADVFSWTITLVSRVRLDLRSYDAYFNTGEKSKILSQIRKMVGRDAEKVNLPDLLWRRFGINGVFQCDECKRSPCRCQSARAGLAVRLQGPAFQAAKPVLMDALSEFKKEI